MTNHRSATATQDIDEGHPTPTDGAGPPATNGASLGNLTGPSRGGATAGNARARSISSQTGIGSASSPESDLFTRPPIGLDFEAWQAEADAVVNGRGSMTGDEYQAKLAALLETWLGAVWNEPPTDRPVE